MIGSIHYRSSVPVAPIKAREGSSVLAVRMVDARNDQSAASWLQQHQ